MNEAIKVADELEFIDANKVNIGRNAFAELVVQLPDGTTHTKVEPVRSFPVSETNKYIALVNDEGDEIGIVEDVRKLSPQSRDVLTEELQKRYFMPKITKINSLDGQFGVTTWNVETSQGDVEFGIRTRYDIVTLESGRVLLKDADGNKYEIENYNKLDPKSIALLQTQM
ncbi:MAG: DUF1854 domain-containing protein [Candidatus Poribacteria bacterium]|nr:DUF1854 domain-containing protein [Candidatus Poribacteria bacterium]